MVSQARPGQTQHIEHFGSVFYTWRELCWVCELFLKWIKKRDSKKSKIMVPGFKGSQLSWETQGQHSGARSPDGGNTISNTCWFYQAMEVYSKLIFRSTHPWACSPNQEEMEEHSRGLGSSIFCATTIFSPEESGVLFLKYHLILAFWWCKFRSSSTDWVQLEG